MRDAKLLKFGASEKNRRHNSTIAHIGGGGVVRVAEKRKPDGCQQVWRRREGRKSGKIKGAEGEEPQ